MGVVYLAHEVALDRPVALKLLLPDPAGEGALRERFLREARTAARLSHPHIVPIFAVDQVEDFVFFAMAAIQGRTLGERVRTQGPLSNGDATRLVKEVAWALAYAHAQGVVHRDIKPDNILLEEGTGRALVTDFGIAQVGASVDDDAATQVVGTAEFMSPEQARGASVDARSDMYSLAAVGFYAVSGRTPFEGPSASAILGKHLAEPAPNLTSVVPGVSPPLARVVDRCLRKDPERRFLGGESVADALAREDVTERQLPIPLRVFIKNLRELAQSASAAAALVTFLGVPFTVALASRGLLAGVGIVGPLTGMLIAGIGLTGLWHGRKALKAGFTNEEILLALEEDVLRRNEEIRFEVGPRTTVVDRIAARLATFGAGTASVSLVMGMLGGGGVVANTMFTIASMSGVIGLGSAAVLAHRSQKRADIVGERWLGLWGGRVGDALFKVAGFRVKAPASLPSGVHRSTEMVLGLAAVKLFDDLPKEFRRELGDLPATVKALEDDARSLRAQVRELNGVIDELDDDVSGTASDGRMGIHRDVVATRDEAEAGLRTVVAALETIRVGLLRMHAGEPLVQSVTMELEAARDIALNMEGLLEGHREVERLLDERRATGTFTLPADD